MFFYNPIGDKGFDFEVLIVFELFDVSQVNETHKVPNVVIVIDFVLITQPPTQPPTQPGK